MHCIQCGTQNSDSTRFCTRCGYNLENLTQMLMGQSGDDGSDHDSSWSSGHISLLLCMAGVITVVGLLAVFITIGALATNITKIPDHDLPGLLVALAFGGLGGISLIDFLIFRTISSAKASLRKNKKTPNRIQIPLKKAELPSPSIESFTSVVEHTTHRLPEYEAPQPVHREPKHHTK
jgi:hypothetical protein